MVRASFHRLRKKQSKNTLSGVWHVYFSQRCMIQSLPGYMASGAFPRRSPGTSARYWENVKRFPGFYSESTFCSDYNGLKIHRHLLLIRCFISYFLQWTTLSDLCKNYTTTPVWVQWYKGFRRGNVISSAHRFVSSNKAPGFVLTQEHCQDVCLPYVIWKKIKKIELKKSYNLQLFPCWRSPTILVGRLN